MTHVLLSRTISHTVRIFAAVLCLSFGVHAATAEPEVVLNINVNNIAPLGSPSETYKYYSLPFIRPKTEIKSDQSFSQSISGDRVYNSPYVSSLGEQEGIRTIGKKSFTQFELDQFISAIKDNFYAEFYIEEFIAHDMIGAFGYEDNEDEKEKFYLKHHIEFNDIIFANITNEMPEEEFDMNYTLLQLPEGKQRQEITFTYEVKYILANFTDIDYEHDQIFEEFDKENHLNTSEEIQWIAILLSFLLVILLVSFVALVLARILKKDFSLSTDLDNDLSFEIGWKMIKTEALMPPNHKIILSSFLGNGVQFISLVISLVVFGTLGLYYNSTHKGNVKQIALFLYAFTGIFNGFYSAKYYKFFGGKHWALGFISSAVLFPVSFLLVFSVVNSYAWYKESTSAIPYDAVFLVVLIIVVIFAPLTLIGTLTSRIKTQEILANANTILPRLFKPIPDRKIHQSAIIHFLIGGLIPFSSIYLELNQVFNSVWGYSTYHLYGVITIAFILFLIVQACVSIGLTFYQLNAMDYNWWWRSFSYGGSTSLFIAAYVVYFYWSVSSMHGTLQFLMYFGYMVLACLTSFLMLGSVSFFASLKFVRYIYNNSKIE